MADEEEGHLLRGVWSPSPVEKPPSITPAGLPLERQRYLYKRIRKDCRENVQDLVCPNPVPSQDPPDTLPEEKYQPSVYGIDPTTCTMHIHLVYMQNKVPACIHTHTTFSVVVFLSF